MPVGMLRDERIEIRTSVQRKERALQLAKMRGLSLSAWWEAMVDAQWELRAL